MTLQKMINLQGLDKFRVYVLRIALELHFTRLIDHGQSPREDIGAHQPKPVETKVNRPAVVARRRSNGRSCEPITLAVTEQQPSLCRETCGLEMSCSIQQ